MKTTIGLLIFAGIFATLSSQAFATEVSFTIDDPEVTETPLYSPVERNKKILEALENFQVKAALFVCGMRVDNPQGVALLQSWDRGGHVIANHSYSHLYFPSSNITYEKYYEDFRKVEPLLIGLKNFTKLYRFPYLKEGNTPEKRDRMRKALQQYGYGQGYVTIDASDWYIDGRLRDKLKQDPKADLSPYRDFYLKHMWNRSVYYADLAKKVYGRDIKHTVLIHHNLLNALFLKDLIQMYKDKGWVVISAKEAFKDSVFKLEPNIIPAGESIVWASAKQTGKFESLLRYPAEDGMYEKPEMDRLGL